MASNRQESEDIPDNSSTSSSSYLSAHDTSEESFSPDSRALNPDLPTHEARRGPLQLVFQTSDGYLRVCSEAMQLLGQNGDSAIPVVSVTALWRQVFQAVQSTSPDAAGIPGLFGIDAASMGPGIWVLPKPAGLAGQASIKVCSSDTMWSVQAYVTSPRCTVYSI